MTDQELTEEEFPSPEKFLLEISLYKYFPITSALDILNLEFYQGTIDAFCIECKRDTAFLNNVRLPEGFINNNRVNPGSVDNLVTDYKLMWLQDCYVNPLSTNHNFQEFQIEEYAFSDRKFPIAFVCPREPEQHKLFFFFNVRSGKVTKVGQYPSYADLQFNELNKYSKVLSEDMLIEFKRAVGLDAHGIGVGSFVYLRRIFEDQINQAYLKAKNDSHGKMDDNDFYRLRMEEKIKLLKDYLPSFLYENSSIYAILSMGIHELSEEECINNFHAVKKSIELILDEKLAEKEKLYKEEETKKMLTKISTEIAKTQTSETKDDNTE